MITFLLNLSYLSKVQDNSFLFNRPCTKSNWVEFLCWFHYTCIESLSTLGFNPILLSQLRKQRIKTIQASAKSSLAVYSSSKVDRRQDRGACELTGGKVASMGEGSSTQELAI